MMIIDPHVHLRGREYPNHDFLRLAIRDCMQCGIAGVAEMPNPDPWLIDGEAITYRTALVDQKVGASGSGLGHLVNIGLTNDIEQVRRAIFTAKHRDRIGGIKMFLTHSTGNMGILDHGYQRQVWRTLVDEGYDGTVMQHLEDEIEWVVPFNYENPISHSLRQNPESEYVQAERQLANAMDAGFRGTFYICHCSNPATIDLVERVRLSGRCKFHIVVEMAWHHMLLNYNDYHRLGNRVKMNPPLRSPRMQELLLEAALGGRVDIIGSDHAPHPLENKLFSTPASGIPALLFWRKGLELLRGYGAPPHLLEQMAFRTALRIFPHFLDELRGISVPQEGEPYNPSLWDDYGWNPFERIDRN